MNEPHNRNGYRPLNPPADHEASLQKFVAMVKATVDFGTRFTGDEEIKERVITMTVLGRTREALDIVQAHSNLGSAHGTELINRIEIAADRVFYLTGLRP